MVRTQVNPLLQETVRLLKKYGVKPKKRLSQSFVVDERLIKMTVETLNPKLEDVVVEIGAGLGTLTLRLAELGSKVIAVEIDPVLLRVLRDRLSPFSNVKIVQGDFTEISIEGNVFTGNIPYHVSTPIVFKILNQEYNRAVITVQKEVAERIVSTPGSENYGRLTVSVGLRADVKIVGVFPSSSFYPRPRVSHALILMRPLESREDLSFLEPILRIMFNQRRRLARTVLKRGLAKIYGEKGMEIYNAIFRLVPEDKRVFELSVEDFLRLSKAIRRFSMGA
ncbi:MAG: 16S rRNA (adenine(1518)-N(6)/adenine(1519)-N(6))-dimethyltransferase RsmA [Thermoproteota archaeon]